MANPNIELLTRVAEALGDLRERVVLVGGCATALLITDPAATNVRATNDVDAIIAIVSKPAYYDLGEALRAKGFSQPLEEGDPPYCSGFGDRRALCESVASGTSEATRHRANERQLMNARN